MTPEEIRKLTEELKKQAEIQQQVSRSIDDYVEGMRQYKKTLSEIIIAVDVNFILKSKLNEK